MSAWVAPWFAIVPGEAVWSALALLTGGWVVVTSRVPAMVGAVEVLRWLLGSWAGRLLALAAWGGAGWHLFCQRP